MYSKLHIYQAWWEHKSSEPTS